MWKRDESVKPTTPPPPAPRSSAGGAARGRAPAPQHHDARPQIERDKVNIGKSVVIKGELSGSEDLTIEGHCRGPDRAARQRADHRAQRQDPRGSVRQVGHRARARSSATSRPRRRSTSATTARSTATSSRRAWRLPRARTSAAASTCSAPAPSPRRLPRQAEAAERTRAAACLDTGGARRSARRLSRTSASARRDAGSRQPTAVSTVRRVT